MSESAVHCIGVQYGLFYLSIHTPQNSADTHINTRTVHVSTDPPPSIREAFGGNAQSLSGIGRKSGDQACFTPRVRRGGGGGSDRLHVRCTEQRDSVSAGRLAARCVRTQRSQHASAFVASCICAFKHRPDSERSDTPTFALTP